MKYMLNSRGHKPAIRGRLPLSGDDSAWYEKNIDKAFDDFPESFRGHASRTSDEFVEEFKGVGT